LYLFFLLIFTRPIVLFSQISESKHGMRGVKDVAIEEALIAFKAIKLFGLNLFQGLILLKKDCIIEHIK
jgi:hypothetical protein